ncbi:hypothetical protein BAUCODRAFT_80702 [Baudoinia panamericana UAMH 10762]|uniref:DUF7779 domain-containing protein n=1 Tax=Baudoinia panamericana (strain UAMH 10762) TaxID=717646 RepID=M2LAI8_BAUPA|nr:uncharacterized protein BAUCODRAFT_80702 [Baudoinia panamericana UAMH 10762]EMC90827.1 hypothetical protein BAUCODRAFT_80702 [Baudoinia panamericana UAMH 10762]
MGTEKRESATKRARIEFLPVCEHGAILLTSRSRAAARELVDDRLPTVVEPMSQKQAVLLLHRKVGQTNDGEATEKLVAALEYMPLAISQAGSCIEKKASRCTVEQYLGKLEKSEQSTTSLLSAKSDELRRGRETNKLIMLTWQISFEHMYENRRSAADLLSLMSFYDHQGIPAMLLRHPESDSASNSSVDDAFEDDVDVLRDFSFISVAPSGSAFEMHRLVQLATRRQHDQWAEHSVRRLDAVLPDAEYEAWSTCRLLYPHAKVALSLSSTN